MICSFVNFNVLINSASTNLTSNFYTSQECLKYMVGIKCNDKKTNNKKAISEYLDELLNLTNLYEFKNSKIARNFVIKIRFNNFPIFH